MNILITGAGRGIGAETALYLARETECVIYALSRNETNLDRLIEKSVAQKTKGKIIKVVFDLTDKNTEPILALAEEAGRIDLLINNAGRLINKSFEQLEDEDWQTLFEVNVFGPVRLTRCVLPFMGKTDKAHIVNIGSMGGFQGSGKFPGLSAYSSAKAALANLTECLAEELGPKNIAVNCLALGAVRTEMLAEAFPGYEAPVSSKEMAAFIGNFALTAHKCINGKIIPISLSTP